jgi:uncharacterized protein DUF4382
LGISNGVFHGIKRIDSQAMKFNRRLFMSISRTRNFFLILGCLGALTAVAWLVGCGSSTKSSSGGTVTTTMSDPPVCSTTSAPMGPFSAVWVTVTKITANINAGAGPSDSGWQTLIDLTSNPMQVNLFNATATDCFLTTLGKTSGLPAGDYQQIRIFLLDNSSSSGPATNNCGSGNGWNCVMDTNGTHELTLPSEVQTGLKIPSGQIAGGKFTIAAGQSADLDIDFNACASIVMAGASGQFLLKPVLHAGEVAVNNNTIGGTVVDSASGNGIMGATVLLEQPATVTGITDQVDEIIFATTTDSNGNFFFCPVQGTPGTTMYDVVIAAQTTGATYNPDIVFSVPVGTALGNLKMISEGVASLGGLTGQITSHDTGAIAEDVTLQTLTRAMNGTTEFEVTIPSIGSPGTNSTLAASEPQNFMTQATANVVVPPVTCPAGTDCYNYSINLPASAAVVSTFPALPTPPGSPTNTINYDLLGIASGCTASTPSPAFVTPLTVTPTAPTAVPTVLAFTGCT